ncbi:uncharacterized protein LOC127790166 [Diospyros lotus]|uniref:uncharacterized protein LOC127790166 n=1 Tax=Diospyros lotus TaxID=55363 RepID=UPI0022525F46|nr:uncharacterized protein LOC127790166 [Diospyros lotus]
MRKSKKSKFASIGSRVSIPNDDKTGRSPSPSSTNRQQPLLEASKPCSMRVGEVAGGTAAECAAVCCCPCALLVNLLVLAVYKLPAGLCRKALQGKRRRRLTKQGLLPQRSSRCHCGCDDTEVQIHPISVVDLSPAAESLPPDKEVLQLEKEMWDRFYSTGFWRSPSQRSNFSP